MYTLRKLQKMKPELRLRKAIVLLKQYEQDLSQSRVENFRFMQDFIHLLLSEPDFPESLDSLGKRILDENLSDLRDINSFRYGLIDLLGESRADWDFDNILEIDHPFRCVYPVNLYLDGIRSPFNAGSMIRTSEAMGFSKVFYSNDMTVMDHKRTQRTSMGSLKYMESSLIEVDDIPGPLVALELGGTNIHDFKFPGRGTIAVGSEELGVSRPVLDRAANEGGIVSIPLFGIKASLNVGNAFSIIAYEWIKSINQ